MLDGLCFTDTLRRRPPTRAPLEESAPRRVVVARRGGLHPREEPIHAPRPVALEAEDAARVGDPVLLRGPRRRRRAAGLDVAVDGRQVVVRTPAKMTRRGFEGCNCNTRLLGNNATGHHLKQAHTIDETWRPGGAARMASAMAAAGLDVCMIEESWKFPTPAQLQTFAAEWRSLGGVLATSFREPWSQAAAPLLPRERGPPAAAVLQHPRGQAPPVALGDDDGALEGQGQEVLDQRRDLPRDARVVRARR